MVIARMPICCICNIMSRIGKALLVVLPDVNDIVFLFATVASAMIGAHGRWCSATRTATAAQHFVIRRRKCLFLRGTSLPAPACVTHNRCLSLLRVTESGHGTEQCGTPVRLAGAL